MPSLASGHTLHRIILASVAAHAAGIVTTLALLSPGLDLGAVSVTRAAHVAAHPFLWRLGWMPWAATAVLNLALSISLANVLGSTPGRRGVVAARLALVFTLLAVVPDLWGQGLMHTAVVDAAARSVAGGQLAQVEHLQIEARAIMLTGVCANAGYTGTLICWLAAIARAGRGPLTGFIGLGSLVSALFVATVPVAWVGCALASVDLGYPAYDALWWLNAAAFPLLLVWLLWADARLDRGETTPNVV